MHRPHRRLAFVIAALTLGTAACQSPGARLDPVIAVTNTGDAPMTGVTVVTHAPPGTTFLNAGGTGTPGPALIELAAACPASGTVITCEAGTVAPGDQLLVPVSLRVDAATPPGNTLPLVATVSASTPDDDPGDDTASAQVTVAASPAPGDGGTSTGARASDLATTGSDSLATVWVALLFVAAGTSVLVTRRAARP